MIPAGSYSALDPQASSCVSITDVQDYMPLVRRIVARFLRKLPPNVLRDDLLAAGTFGLIDSLRKNKDDRGPTFEWYARIRIRGAILDELRAQDWLTRRARNRIASQGGDGQAMSSVVGLDDLSESGRNGLFDEATPSPLDVALEHADRNALLDAIGTLMERERRIITLHYFQGVQLKAIAAELGVSEPRVSQLHARAMTKLRAALEARTEGEAA